MKHRSLCTPAACRRCCNHQGPWRRHTCSPAWGRKRRGSLQVQVQQQRRAGRWAGQEMSGTQQAAWTCMALMMRAKPQPRVLPTLWDPKWQQGDLQHLHTWPPKHKGVQHHSFGWTHCTRCQRPQQRSPEAALQRRVPPAWSTACLQNRGGKPHKQVLSGPDMCRPATSRSRRVVGKGERRHTALLQAAVHRTTYTGLSGTAGLSWSRGKVCCLLAGCSPCPWRSGWQPSKRRECREGEQHLT